MGVGGKIIKKLKITVFWSVQAWRTPQSPDPRKCFTGVTL